MGYHKAGFQVVGVDLKPQPHYPFEFFQVDALAFLKSLTTYTDSLFWGGLDAIHASPPCQRYSALLKGRDKTRESHADLVGPTRDLLRQTGLPYVIENVPGAPLENWVQLCGGSFDLGLDNKYLQRHRWFEANFPIMVPACSHPHRRAVGVYGHGKWDNENSDRRGGYQGSAAEKAEAMGIDWMNRDELAQAVPPAYTEFIGYQLLVHLGVTSDAIVSI